MLSHKLGFQQAASGHYQHGKDLPAGSCGQSVWGGSRALREPSASHRSFGATDNMPQ